MIDRVWHGWTTHSNADVYEKLLRTEIFAGIIQKNIPGFHSIRLLRRELEQEVEFVTILRFDSLDTIRNFTGEDYEQSYVPDKARAVLSRFDERAQHYEVVEERTISS